MKRIYNQTPEQIIRNTSQPAYLEWHQQEFAAAYRLHQQIQPAPVLAVYQQDAKPAMHKIEPYPEALISATGRKAIRLERFAGWAVVGQLFRGPAQEARAAYERMKAANGELLIQGIIAASSTPEYCQQVAHEVSQLHPDSPIAANPTE